MDVPPISEESGQDIRMTGCLDIKGYLWDILCISQGNSMDIFLISYGQFMDIS